MLNHPKYRLDAGYLRLIAHCALAFVTRLRAGHFDRVAERWEKKARRWRNA